MATLIFSAEPSSPWFRDSLLTIAFVLLALNVLLIVLVHGRRIRQYFRSRRERQFQAKLGEVISKLDDPVGVRDRVWLQEQLAGFDELEQPLVAVALIERLGLASAEERQALLAVLREVGAVDLLVRQTRSRIPWRRALAVRTLGWIAAVETVPLLIGLADDRNHYVREASVRALGQIRDRQALPLLGELFRNRAAFRRASSTTHSSRTALLRSRRSPARSDQLSSRYESPPATASLQSAIPSRRALS